MECWRQPRGLIPACPGATDVILDIPVRLQRAQHDCGDAVARAVLRKWRRPMPDLSAAGWPSLVDGTDPRVLEALFRAAGLPVVSGEMTVEDLRHHARQGRPVVCLVSRNGTGHYIVSKGVRYRRVHAMCPADGSVDFGVDDFEQCWRDVCRDGTVMTNWGIAVG